MACTCSVCGRVIEATPDYSSWPDVLGKQASIYPVTDNERLSGQLIGFICAGCLTAANKVRLDLKSKMAGVQVSHHALDRYLERHKGEPLSEESAELSIIRMFNGAKQIEFKNPSRVAKMQANHGPSAYWFNTGWIFFTTPQRPWTVKTIYFARQFNLRLHLDFDFLKVQKGS